MQAWIQLNRISLKYKCSLLLFLLIAFLLPADDLERASALMKEGRREEARTVYLDWLKADANRNSPSYGRTLLQSFTDGRSGRGAAGAA